MDIVKHNFATYLPQICDAIFNADFIAIDTEYSGNITRVNRPWTVNSQWDTMSTRYRKMRENVQTFQLMQLGIATFRWEDAMQGYACEVFQLLVFPKNQDAMFSCQVKSLRFLASHHFDFTRWVYNGIPYLRVDEEEAQRALNEDHVNNTLADIMVDAEGEIFLSKARELVNAWMVSRKTSEMTDDYVNVSTRNNYQKRILHQMIRAEYAQVLRSKSFTNFVQVCELHGDELGVWQEERRQLFEANLQQDVGLRHVMDAMMSAQKPTIGHNVLIDLMYVYDTFVQDLPLDWVVCERQLFRLSTSFFDTKYVACISAFQGMLDGTSLEAIVAATCKSPFVTPTIHVPIACRTSSQYHNAGYDAYQTGVAFLRMANYLDAGKGNVMNSANLTEYVNRLYTDRSKHLKYVHLQHANPNVEHIPDVLFIQQPHTTIPFTVDLLKSVLKLACIEIALVEPAGLGAWWVQVKLPHANIPARLGVELAKMAFESKDWVIQWHKNCPP